MDKKLVCPICGEPTSSYMGKYRRDRLCKKHALDLKNGIIEIATVGLSEADNTYRLVISDKAIIKNALPCENKQNECVVCGSNTKNNYLQCADCYQETREYMGGLNRNDTVSGFRQYYYNLKDYIFRLKDIEKVKTNCNKLIAIAVVDNNSNDDAALLERVYKDVQELIEKKTKV